MKRLVPTRGWFALSESTIGVAVIGAGMAGRAHAAAYRAAGSLYGAGLPDVRLVAVADSYEPFAVDTARRFGYDRSETDWRAIADAPDVDAVSVVVANRLHREVVEGLLAAGKHVICEKPLAPTVEDAQAMIVAARATDRVAVVGFTFRRSPAIAAVAELADSGVMGAPVHFDGHYWCDYACDPQAPMSWRYQGPPGSGALADIGSHLIDTGEFLCGPVTSVRGAVMATFVTERAWPAGAAVGHAAAELSDRRAPVENEDLVTFSAQFASGAIGTLSASRSAPGRPNALGFELSGARAAAGFDLSRAGEFLYFDTAITGPTAGERRVLAGPRHPYLNGGLAMDFPGVGYGQNDLFVYQARAFLNQICGLDGLPPCPSLEHGRHNLQVLQAVVDSCAKDGAEVAVPDH
jgi:predicted dehydrogenase